MLEEAKCFFGAKSVFFFGSNEYEHTSWNLAIAVENALKTMKHLCPSFDLVYKLQAF